MRRTMRDPHGMLPTDICADLTRAWRKSYLVKCQCVMSEITFKSS
jgi:hypothetical protein